MTYDVVVIGGGLAGLSAAHTLSHLGRKVGLFEASARLGGRVFSLSLNQYRFHPNALTIQGDEGNIVNPLRAILDRHRIRTKPLSTLQAETFDTTGNKVSLLNLHISLEPEYSKALRLIQEAKTIPKQPVPTLAEILGYHEPISSQLKVDSPVYWARKFITAMLKSHTGAPLEEVSLLELMQGEWGSDENYIILGGAQKLTEALYQEANATGNLTIFLNTPIVKVYQDYNRKTGMIESENNIITLVDHKNQSYHTKGVVVAVPFSVLKHHKINFIPELSHAKRNALDRFGVSYYNSVTLEFEQIFWDNEAHYLYPNGPNIQDWPQYLNDSHFSGAKATLIAQYSGKKAKFSHRTDQAIVEEALQPLKRVYSKKMSPLKSFYISRFDTDHNILGGSLYCSTRNRKEDFDALSSPEHGCYFAGDYTYAKRHGRLESAFESGLQAGLEMDAYLHYKEDLQKQQGRSSRPNP